MARDRQSKNKAEQALMRKAPSNRQSRQASSPQRDNRRVARPPVKRPGRGYPAMHDPAVQKRVQNRPPYKSQADRQREEREQRIRYNDGYAGFEQEFIPAREKRKPKSPARRRALKIITFAILVVAFVVVGIVLSCTVFFKTENINVIFPKNFTRYTSQQIIDESMLQTGDNLFLSDKFGAEKRIKSAFPYIKSVDVKVSLPDTLNINIAPAVPTYYSQQGSKFVILGDNDRILEIADKADKLSIPLLKGIDLKSSRAGDYAEFSDETSKKVLHGIMSAIESCKLKDINEIDMTLASSITLTYQGRIKISVGTHEDILYKLKTAKTIIEQKLTKDDIGTLDVSLCNDAKKQSSFLPADLDQTETSDTDSESSDSDKPNDSDSVDSDSTGDTDNTGDADDAYVTSSDDTVYSEPDDDTSSSEDENTVPDENDDATSSIDEGGGGGEPEE